jgi:hypothetical protein
VEPRQFYHKNYKEAIILKKIIAALILVVTGLLLVAAYSQAADITRQSISIETNPLKINLKNITTDLKDKQSSMASTSYMTGPAYQWGYYYNCISNNASFAATNDGGFVIAGDSGGAINLFKVDNNGNLMWIQKYSSSGRYTTNSVQQTTDNGYIMAGIHENGTTYEVFILKIDSLGLTNWYTTFPADNVTADVKQTLSGGYAVVGTVSNNVKLLVLDSAGNTLWSTLFRNYSAWETGRKVIVEKVNGYIDILTKGQNNPVTGSGYSALWDYHDYPHSC